MIHIRTLVCAAIVATTGYLAAEETTASWVLREADDNVRLKRADSEGLRGEAVEETPINLYQGDELTVLPGGLAVVFDGTDVLKLTASEDALKKVVPAPPEEGSILSLVMKGAEKKLASSDTASLSDVQGGMVIRPPLTASTRIADPVEDSFFMSDIPQPPLVEIKDAAGASVELRLTIPGESDPVTTVTIQPKNGFQVAEWQIAGRAYSRALDSDQFAIELYAGGELIDSKTLTRLPFDKAQLFNENLQQLSTQLSISSVSKMRAHPAYEYLCAMHRVYDPVMQRN